MRPYDDGNILQKIQFFQLNKTQIREKKTFNGDNLQQKSKQQLFQLDKHVNCLSIAKSTKTEKQWRNYLYF